MQKGLIAGGVYHVMMPDGGRQYCLWNGKQLVPCEFATSMCSNVFLYLYTRMHRPVNYISCGICCVSNVVIYAS